MSTWVVVMVHQMSGGRYDDRPWPPPGYEFEVPDWEGEGLVRSSSAVKIRELDDDLPAYVTPPAPVSLPAETAAGPAEPSVWIPDAGLTLLPESPPGSAVDVPAEPRPADPKQAWIDYAVSQGEPADTAGAMTKADLMSKYGGRM